MNNTKRKVCLITGANSGHGMAVAAALARTGMTVIMGCRSIERAEAVRSQLVRDSGNESIAVLAIDLASRRSIHEAVHRFRSEHNSLDVLVNNAGAWWADRRVSVDGFELVWATNVLGPLLLTRLLLPSLRSSGAGRIVNVSSTWAGGLDLDDVEFTRRPYKGIQAYQSSKQANRMLTWTLAEQLSGQPVVANGLCPGFMKTGLGRNAPLGFRLFMPLMRPFQTSPKDGADTAIWLASSSEGASLTNQFFVKRSPAPCKYRDPVARERLWHLCRTALMTSD